MSDLKPVPLDKNTQNELSVYLDSFIKAETNLERLPFFAPWTKSRSKKLKHTLTRKTTRDGVDIEISWTVAANPEYGYPNAFDLDVYRAVQQIIHDYYSGKVPEDGIISFSLRQVEQRMWQPHSGRLKRDIRESLERLVATTVKSKGAFYYKGTRQFIDDTFHIFDRVTFVGQTLPGGGMAETNMIELSRWYRDSLKSWYVMPLDNNFHFSMRSSSAKSLYGLLSFYFYCRPGNQEWIRRKYSDLCEETIITRQKYFSVGFRYLERAFSELIDKKFLSKVEAKPFTEPTKFDGWIYFYPGERILEPDKFRINDAQLMLWDYLEPQKKVLPKPQDPTKDDEVSQLIKSFYSQLNHSDSTQRSISKNEFELVSQWADQNGVDFLKKFIEYALEQKRTRWEDMASITGALNAFGDEFLKRLQEQQKREAEQEIMDREFDRIEQLRVHYRIYFEDRITFIKEQYPDLYQKYKETLDSNPLYGKQNQSMEDGGTFWKRSIETIEENLAVQFFSPETVPHSDCIILDFTAWRDAYEKTL